MNLKQQEAKAQKLVDKFNSENPVGTTVEYWTGVREGKGEIGKTRSVARTMSCEAVVWIEDVGSCIALSHVKELQLTR